MTSYQPLNILQISEAMEVAAMSNVALSPAVKASRMTKALMQLASEYALDTRTQKQVKMITEIAVDLPNETKVRLFDILASDAFGPK